MLDIYCSRNGLNPILVTFVSGLLLKGKRIYLAAFASEFILVYLNISTCSVNLITLKTLHDLPQ
jgi:hypothetical protein